VDGFWRDDVIIMRSITSIMLTILLGLAVSNADEQVLSLVTSSPFDMRLAPITAELDIAVTSKVEHAIRTALFLSTSVTSNFESVFDINIVLQQVEWTRDNESALFRFEVRANFFKDDLEESPPSQFALDSLIARTFSQPSTKSSFITTLGISKESLLAGVDEVEIQLVDETLDHNPVTNKSKSLSSVDIILITASASILLCMLYCVYLHYKDRAGNEEQHLRNLRRSWKKQARATRPSSQGATNEGSADPVNKTSCQSDDSSEDGAVENDESLQDLATSKKLPVGLIGLHRSNIVVPLEMAAVSSSSDTTGSPPISPFSSMPSSPAASSRSSTSSPCSSLPPSPIADSPSTKYLLGAPPPNYPIDSVSSSSSSDLSPLTARLLRLPMMNSADASDRDPLRSSNSAPGILMCATFSLRSTEDSSSKGDEKSVRSARSALSLRSARSTSSLRSARSASSLRSARSASSLRSARSASEIIGISQPYLETSTSNITDLAVISEQSILNTTENFENNWEEAEQMALEDEEDGSVDDVFHIDVEAQDNVEDNQSRMSGLSAVSEWLKSIRVVGDSSDTKTSDMSHSSAEHSSVEPRSAQMKDTNSVDCSLERSLAASIVEI
jgi:hypothetical protein